MSIPPDVVLPTEVNTEGIAAGNTAGALRVSSDGDLTYDFPLWVPPGRNGMQPELSISYRGRAGNGPLGVGWSIAGLSQIVRCPQNTAENGQTAAINFSVSDRFCLDGQQLIALTGSYGADGTEYRTERDIFAKIVSGTAGCAGADSEGPTCFKVFLRSGRVLTYGRSASNPDANAAIEGQRVSRTVPDPSQPNAVTDTSQLVRYAWALARAEDRFGNGINYRYLLNRAVSDDGEPTYEFEPDSITYTDTQDHSFPALKSVKFIYQPRPDVRVFYVSGLRMTLAQRLWQIGETGPNPITRAVVRLYRLAYRNDSVTHRSLLESIYDCDGQGVCRAPLTFDWEMGALTFQDVDTGIHDVTFAMSGDPSGQGGSPPPLAKSGALTSWISSTSRTDQIQHVGYVRGDGDPARDSNLYEVYLHPGEQPWAWHGIGAFRAAGGNGLTSWTSSASDTHVAYVGTDGHIYVFSKHARELAVGADATTSSGAPIAQGGALTSWVTTRDNLQHVAYIDGNGRIDELYSHMGPGKANWSFDQPTWIAHAPSAQGGALTSWVSATDDTQHVAYIEGNGHIDELFLKVGMRDDWSVHELMKITGAPNAQGGALTSWVSTEDNLEHVAYIDGKGRVDELFQQIGLTPDHWSYDEPTQTSGGPNAQAGALTSWMSDVDKVQHIAYVDTSGHIQELFLPIGLGGDHWAVDDPTQTSGAPRARAGALTSWLSSMDGLRHIAYVDNNQHVEELYERAGAGPLAWAFDDTSANSAQGGIVQRLAVADTGGTGLDDALLFTYTYGQQIQGQPGMYDWNLYQNLGYKSVARNAAGHVFNQTPLSVIGLTGHVFCSQPLLADARFLDIDRDGRADIVQSCESQTSDFSGLAVSINTSPAGASPFSHPAYTFGQSLEKAQLPPHSMYIGDLDGNGLPSLIYYGPPCPGSGPNCQVNWWYYFYNNDGGWGSNEDLRDASLIAQSPVKQNIFVANVDATGTTSLMLRSSSPGAWWYEATKIKNPGPATGTPVQQNVALVAGEVFQTSPFAVCMPPGDWDCGFADVFVDLRGDGLPDVVSYNEIQGGNPWIARNTGNGFLDRTEIQLAAPVGMTFGGFPSNWSSGWCAYYQGPWCSGYQQDPGILVADLNGDQRQDFIVTGGFPFTGGLVTLLAGDVDFETPMFLTDQDGVALPFPDDPALAAIADVNGDGLPDLLEVVDGELHAYLHMGKRPDVITRVVEGMTQGHTITWNPISNPDAHQAVTNCTFPLVCVKNGLWVVTDVATPDPTGGTRHLSYSYVNARSDGAGIGWLGFEQKQERDSATGTTTLITYDNFTQKQWSASGVNGYSYPFAGLPKITNSSVNLDNGHQFSDRVTTSYQYASNGANGIYSVLPCSIVEAQSEISPRSLRPFRQITRSYQYDGLTCNPSQQSLSFGNATLVSTSTEDRYLTTIKTQYENHTDSWLISLPMEVAETQTTPFGESVTRTQDYVHDAATGALVQQAIEPHGVPSLRLTRQFTRDKTGLLVSVQESSPTETRTVSFGYENTEHVWPAFVSNALSQVEQYAYHPSFGQMVALEDLNGNLTQWQVDGFGRPRTATPPDGGNVTFSYIADTPTSYRIRSSQSGGQETESTIDRFGLEPIFLRRGFDGRQIEIDKQYDLLGRLSQVSNPYFVGESTSGLTTIQYDQLSRIRHIIHPDDSSTEEDYDGLTTDQYDEDRHHGTVLADQLLRPVLITEYADNGHAIKTQYGYGPFGVLESLTDPAGNITRSTFDVLGRRTLLVDPDAGRQSTLWNAFGEVVEETNGAGERLRYTRDLLGRLIRTSSKDGPTKIVWDTVPHGLGEIAAASSPDGAITSFAYDSLSRVSSKTTTIGAQSLAFGFSYDSSGRLAGIRYPQPPPATGLPPLSISFAYTPYGALKLVSETSYGPPVILWANSERNAFDEVTSEKFGNDLTTYRQYDTRGRLLSVLTTDAQMPKQILNYQYYANSDLSARTDGMTQVVEGYTYDSLDRLKIWSVNKNDRPDLKQQFGYDDIGNLTSRTTLVGSDPSLIYVYSKVHAGPHAVTSINGATYSYDNAGREISAPQRRNSTYLSSGLPRRIAGPTASDRFKYDFEDQRILKDRSDGTHSLTVGGLFERTWKRQGPIQDFYYVPGIGQIVAARVDSGPKTGYMFIHEDRLGSVATVTDTSQLANNREYDPFGTRREPSDPAVPDPGSSSELPPGFIERDSDSEVRVMNLMARLYDAQASHFTTPDPLNVGLGSQGNNPYSYAYNNPLRWIDPNGLQPNGQAYDVGFAYGDEEWERPFGLPDWCTGGCYWDVPSQTYGLDLRNDVAASSDDAGTRVPLVPGSSTPPGEIEPTPGDVGPPGPITPSPLTLQQGAFAQTGLERANYALSKPGNAGQILQRVNSGELTPRQGAELAVQMRRSMEAETRANLPGWAAELSGARNIERYGDPLGPKTVEQAAIRSNGGPPKTDLEVIRSSGKSSTAFTVAGVAAGVLGFVLQIEQVVTMAQTISEKGYIPAGAFSVVVDPTKIPNGTRTADWPGVSTPGVFWNGEFRPYTHIDPTGVIPVPIWY